MTNQDPTNPESDTDMIAQMAQFSTLQATTDMSTNLSNMNNSQLVTQADSMLGQTVGLQVDSSMTTSGVVSSVQIQSGTPMLVVGGQTYNLSQVISVTPSSAQSGSSTTTGQTGTTNPTTNPQN